MNRVRPLALMIGLLFVIYGGRAIDTSQAHGDWGRIGEVFGFALLGFGWEIEL